MPELPEVEVLVRRLAPLLNGRTIKSVRVLRSKSIAPTSESQFGKTLRSAKFTEVTRRGKYLLFRLRAKTAGQHLLLVGHLGMTGRMYLLDHDPPLPKHTAVTFDLGAHQFVFEDTRYFGRLTLDTSPLEKLGPEPLGPEFTAEYLRVALQRTSQPVKVKLLDQTLVAGVGNIYASEALFRAGIYPRLAANRLDPRQVRLLWQSIRRVMTQAIRWGSTLPLDINGNGAKDGLFYFGGAGDGGEFHTERLLVYGRRGLPCIKCGTAIERLVQAARSTFYCPACQPAHPGPKSVDGLKPAS
jgi:formamidopyrimidine-DNA glycosylase